MSLNCSTIVRNQIAAPRLFQRLEKQLAKPQAPQVATAIVQVLVDWSHLFGSEELGARCRALLSQPRFGAMAVGCSPSPAVAAMEEEMRLGIPPVAPIRGEDFIRAMYRGASTDHGAAGSAGGSTPRVQPGCIPGGAPPPIAAHAVPLLCTRMTTDAHRLTAALASCRAAARAGRRGELAAAMDGAYREAERCSQWRRRVQDFTQKDDNPAALSSVLSATDVINTSLREWQDFAGGEVYRLLSIAVPPMSAATLRACASSAPQARQLLATAAAAAGRASDVADLLNIGVQPTAQPHPHPPPPAAAAAAHMSHSQSATQIDAFDPFADPPPRTSATALGASAGSNHHGASRPAAAAAPGPSANPFANTVALPAPPAGAPGGPGDAQAARPPHHHAQPSLSDWDPFLSPTPPPAPPPAPPPSAFRTANAPALMVTPGPSGGNDWTLFDGDAPASSVGGSFASPYSPALTSTLPSGVLPSPTNSGPSVTSTPNLTSPRSTAATPQQPATSALPHAATAAGAAGSVSSPPLAAGMNRPQGTAAADRAAALNRSITAPAAGPSTAAAATAATTTATLDWRPDFDRLAAELRALTAAPPHAAAAGGGNAAAAGPPLAEVLSRVRGLCEGLAARHARCIAELERRHAEELRDVKSRSLAKLREVTSAGPATGNLGAGPLSGDGSLARVGVEVGAGGVAGNGAAAAAAAAAAGTNGSGRPGTGQGLSPLFQGLQLHQHSLLHPHAPLPPQAVALKPNGPAAAAPVGAGANGRIAAADFSLI